MILKIVKEIVIKIIGREKILILKNMTSVTHKDKEYLNVCNKASEDDNIFSNFKRNPAYTTVLEHVSYQQGLEYLNQIKSNKVNYDDFKCNDKIGNPMKYKYDVGEFSPTTLRYIKTAYDIFKYFPDIRSVIEIGCGYGGQCLVMNKLFKLDIYYLIDLPEVVKLINKYLTYHNITNFHTIDALNIKDLNIKEVDLVVSNFAFSECNSEIRKLYIENVISKAKYGYMTINYLSDKERHDLIKDIEKLKKQITILPEKPQTGNNNQIFIWSD